MLTHKDEMRDREIMPSRRIPGSDMPRGAMTESEAGAIRGEMKGSKGGSRGEVVAGEMPGGEMIKNEAEAMGEMPGGEMPRGEMKGGL